MWRLAVCMTSWSSAQHQVATVCAGKRLSIDRQQQTGSMESGSGASLSKASPVSSLSRPLQSVRHCLTGCKKALSRGLLLPVSLSVGAGSVGAVHQPSDGTGPAAPSKP